MSTQFPRLFLAMVAAVLGSCLWTTPSPGLTPLRTEEYETRSFRDRDTNRDGKLSPEEYQAPYRPNDPKSKAQIMKTFQRYDTNRDGFISLDEYLAPVRKEQEKRQGKP